MLNTQTHTLPADQRSLDIVARMMKTESAEEFRRCLAAHLEGVKTIFARVVAPRTETGPAGLAAILEGGLDEQSAMKAIAAHGFRDGRRVMRNLKLLTSGSSLSDVQDLDSRAREAFRAVAETLFADFARSPDPDLTLNNFTTIASAHSLPHQLYTQLADERFRKFLLEICAVSPRFALRLSRNPLLMDALTSDVQSLADGDLLALPPSGDLIIFKNQQELRAGVRHVLGLSDEETLSLELARLADFILAEVFADELRKAGDRPSPLALFAVGKYGTREITFDSDLDLIFVADAAGKEEAANLERVAASLVKRISAVSEQGKLYDVDVRLRPEGGSAPLVVSASAYEKYLDSRASLWERQSLTRLRFVCGNRELAGRVSTTVDAAVYVRPLPEDWVDQIVAMRRRMESRSKTMSRTFLDLKLGAGGMADIEFIAQMVQLKYGAAEAGLRTKRVLEILAHPAARGLGDDQRAKFSEAYRFFREVVKYVRITLDEKTSILPEGEKLETLARVFGRTTGEELRVRVANTMKSVRALFLSASAGLGSAP